MRKELRSVSLGYGTLGRLPVDVEPYRHERCVRSLCGFELQQRENDAEWVARALVPFRPYALMLWDVPDRALVSHCIIGNTGQILVSAAPVPARFFATGHSFEEVVKRFEKEGIDAPFWCDFDTMGLGQEMRLKVKTEEGAPVLRMQAVLLGLGAIFI